MEYLYYYRAKLSLTTYADDIADVITVRKLTQAKLS